jgi:hypothetical protein
MVGSNTNDFYTYDAGTQSWISVAPSTIKQPGKGYISTSTIGISDQNIEREFQGWYNHGNVVISVDTGFNLIGNPYPSPINNSSFVTDNNNIDGTLYLWNQKNNASNQGDFATWNSLGVTKGNSNISPKSFMPMAQGFFVKCNTAGSVTFKNAHRISSTDKTFFKYDSTAAKVIRLKVTDLNDSTTWQEAILGFHPEATDELDRLYDGLMYSTSYKLNVFTELNNEAYTIQGFKPLHPGESKNIPFVVTSNSQKDILITIDSNSIDSTDMNVYLIDKYNGNKVDLMQQDYQAVIANGTIADRFEIVFENNPSIVVHEDINAATDHLASVHEVEDQIKLSYNHDQLYLNADFNLLELELFNISGQKLGSYDVNANTFSLDAHQLPKFLVIKVKTETSTYTQKISR